MRSGRQPSGSPAEHDFLKFRRWLLLGAIATGSLLVLGRAFQLQALEGDRWAQVAEDQQRERVPLPARRGAIFDRDGVPLALSHETYRVSVAPRELRNPKAAAGALGKVLGLPASDARRATSPERRWVVLPGRYSAEQRTELGGMRGVYFERRLERFYPQGDVGREVIGVVTGDGRALGGIEQQLDDLLRGTPGYSVLRRDARGGAQPTISLPVVPPQDGADVYLTIDFDLQEIADGALREAIHSTGASGGDLLITDPGTGELLAAVSRRGGKGRSLTAVTEPYEPGSTLKPFAAASLLAEGRAELSDTVFAEEGRWRAENGRLLTDSHPHEWLSLADALRVSSNIGIAKFAARLAPGEQYQYLRDFGFGTPTGIAYPAESFGRLRLPSRWSKYSSASLAMGYEISVTPLQLAMGYGALANGGVLMAPRLIRKVRGPEGKVLERREPQAIRRVVSPRVTERLTDVLVSVVEDGTATRAALHNLQVAGKTGTARRTGGNGRYERGSYTATFVSYFPAQNPQLVLFVKLDEPQGSYYGGTTAAPVTRETLQGILAAHASELDGRTLLAARAGNVQGGAPAAGAGGSRPTGREGTYVFLLEEGLPAVQEKGLGQPVSVPSLEGLPLRDAVRRLHALGFRVRLEGSGAVRGTRPAAGASLLPGDTLTVVGEVEG